MVITGEHILNIQVKFCQSNLSILEKYMECVESLQVVCVL